MKSRFYAHIWGGFDRLYIATGLRWQTPIELVFPGLGPWLFWKMTGLKGREISFLRTASMQEESKWGNL